MRIGYACQAVGIYETNFKSCTRKNATEENLLSVINHNLNALENIIDYNRKNKIHLFRITSDLIPFGSSPVNQLKWWEIFQERFGRIGQLVRENDIRISMHPGQYTVLNSTDDTVVERAVADLEYHAKLLESIDPDQKNKIILHIGGAYGDKKKAMECFVTNYQKLEEAVKKHLVIENDDKIYNIEEVMETSLKTGAPVVFDVLHHQVNPDKEKNSANSWIKQCGYTWKSEDGVQKIHYSEQNPVKQPGSHSETITAESFMTFINELGSLQPDIMLEVKDKNLSAVKCINLMEERPNILMLEKEWSRYKYLVLEKSQNDYKYIRQLLKEKEKYPVMEFYKTLDHARFLEESKGDALNAVNHVWGYFKKQASEKEKDYYQKLIQEYGSDKKQLNSVKNIYGN
ncbi:UV DNA damage repair endonuclease UvsE [Aminipila terrae]|uniref:UV DNA damage repair endonuclease UvsE n=1 Tax=Aminipila terrae TaxID=2697030 RepID=UPI001FAD5985|nr:UV DNA damage repair endonuclease UvsE [Aminipila terrae]